MASFDSSFLNDIGDTLRAQRFDETLAVLERWGRSRGAHDKGALGETGERVRRHLLALVLDAPNMAAIHDEDSIKNGFAALASWLRLAPPGPTGIEALLEEIESFLEMETNDQKRLAPGCALGLGLALTELTRHGFDPENPSRVFQSCLAFEDVQRWRAEYRAEFLDSTLSTAATENPRFRL